jgi:hypothetical protein
MGFNAEYWALVTADQTIAVDFLEDLKRPV